MSRRPGSGLTTLERVKRSERDVAAEQLAIAEHGLTRELDRLAQLEQYATEYREHEMTATAEWQRLRDGQQFMLEVERALERQRAAVEREQAAVEQARAHWLSLRMQREALGKLLERRDADDAERSRRAEQRHSDEAALQSALRQRRLAES